MAGKKNCIGFLKMITSDVIQEYLEGRSRNFLFNEIRELSGSLEAEFQYTLRGANEVEDILTKNGAHRKELYAGLMLQFL